MSLNKHQRNLLLLIRLRKRKWNEQHGGKQSYENIHNANLKR